MKRGILWKKGKLYRSPSWWRKDMIKIGVAVALFLVGLFGTTWIQAGDLGGFDVSVSEGENWSLPDNWQEETSGWAEEPNTGNATESGETSSTQNNHIENTDNTASIGGESADIFSSVAESSQQNNQQQNNQQQNNQQQNNQQQNNQQQNSSQKNNRQNNMRQENNTQDSKPQENNSQESNQQGSVQQQSPAQQLPEQQSSEPKETASRLSDPKKSNQDKADREKTDTKKADTKKTDIDTEKTEMADMEAADAGAKVYISQEERQKSREQDRAVNLRRTKDMTFFHKKQVNKEDILYLTVTRLNIYQILSVRLNGKECRWNREGSRIVLKDGPTQGKNKVEVRFFREDGQITGMEPWIFTCT